jgi:hypothetical protein
MRSLENKGFDIRIMLITCIDCDAGILLFVNKNTT